jgi:hypothetical protein
MLMNCTNLTRFENFNFYKLKHLSIINNDNIVEIFNIFAPQLDTFVVKNNEKLRFITKIFFSNEHQLKLRLSNNKILQEIQIN